jgi:hypothetical protein
VLFVQGKSIDFAENVGQRGFILFCEEESVLVDM